MEYYFTYIRAGVRCYSLTLKTETHALALIYPCLFFCYLSIGRKNVCVAVSLFVLSVFQNLWNATRGVKAQLMKEIYNHNASQYLPMVIAGKCFVFILQEYI